MADASSPTPPVRTDAAAGELSARPATDKPAAYRHNGAGDLRSLNLRTSSENDTFADGHVVPEDLASAGLELLTAGPAVDR